MVGRMAQLEGIIRSFATPQEFDLGDGVNRDTVDPSDLWIRPGSFQIVPEQAAVKGTVLYLTGPVRITNQESEADARAGLVRLAQDLGANAVLGARPLDGTKDGHGYTGYPAIVMERRTTGDLGSAAASQTLCDEMVDGLQQRYATYHGSFASERILRAVFWGLFGALVATLFSLLSGA